MEEQVSSLWIVEARGSGQWLPLQWYFCEEDAEAAIPTWKQHSMAAMRVRKFVPEQVTA